jgi:LiaI-LiaF-like transmembrane region/N-terminal domain of toast_rack, DUF2154
MKPGRVFWGVFFVLLGLLLVADRFDVFVIPSFSWWKFWPLILVLFGIALLLRKSPRQWIPVALGGAALAVMVASFSSFSWIDSGFQRGGELQSQTLVVPMERGVEKSSLNLETGAGVVELGDTTAELVQANTETTFGEYRIERDSTEAGEEVRLSLEGRSGRGGWALGRMRNRVVLRLNTEPVWNLEFSLGASKVNLDLEEYAVENLRLDCGASTSRIRIGPRLPETNVDINAGASSIRMEVPESSGCEVRLDAPLSSKKFPGFNKVRDGVYRTENYDTSPRRVNIGIDAGVSSVRISRY